VQKKIVISSICTAIYNSLSDAIRSSSTPSSTSYSDVSRHCPIAASCDRRDRRGSSRNFLTAYKQHVPIDDHKFISTPIDDHKDISATTSKTASSSNTKNSVSFKRLHASVSCTPLSALLQIFHTRLTLAFTLSDVQCPASCGQAGYANHAI
jgi:hypothetical protein